MLNLNFYLLNMNYVTINACVFQNRAKVKARFSIALLPYDFFLTILTPTPLYVRYIFY